MRRRARTMGPAWGGALLVCLAAGALACTDHLDLGKNVHVDAGSCAVGNYAGTFTCAQGALAALQQAVSGPIVFTVVADIDEHGDVAGFSVPTTAGATADTLGGTFSSTLAGTLDCPDGSLAGTLSNITVTSAGLVATLAGEGTFTGTYALDGGAPGFVDGVMTIPGLPDAATAECSWGATHQ